MKKKIAIIESTGAKQEVMKQALKALDAIAEQFDHRFEYYKYQKNNADYSDEAVQACKSCDAVLLTGTEQLETARQPFAVFATVQLLVLRTALQHLSPLKLKNIEGTNLLLFQEYKNEAVSTAEKNRERICQSAFKQALTRHKKVTFVSGAKPEGPWRESLKALAQKFPAVILEQSNVTTMLADLIIKPSYFDIIIADHSAADLLINQVNAISGISKMIPSITAGEDVMLFSPAYGFSDADSAKDIANPLGAVLSVALLLDYFVLHEEATLVRAAVNWALWHGFVTKDLDPFNNYSTDTVGDLIADFIKGAIPGFSKGENIQLHKSTII